MNKNTKSLLWGLLAGSAIGSVAGLLLAPKSGKELRKDIADGTNATLDKAHELVQQASDKGTEWYGIVKESVETIIQEVSEWGKSGGEAAEEAKTAVVSAYAAEAEVAADVQDADSDPIETAGASGISGERA